MLADRFNREINATDALIAAALCMENFEHLTEQDVENILASAPQLSEEDLKALKSLGDNFFFDKSDTLITASIVHHRCEEPVGMYRAGSDQELTPELREEIERKRQEIRNRLQNNRKNV